MSVVVVVYIAVSTVSINSARAVINDNLNVTASVFRSRIEARNQRLVEAARLLSGDYAFKQAYATRDHDTLLSALSNHRERIGADMIVLVSMDGEVIANTLHPEHAGTEAALLPLVQAAENSEYGEAASMTIMGEQLYQVVVVPLLIPIPDAWICIGFLVDDKLVWQLQKETLSFVSILSMQADDTWGLAASVLPGQLSEALPEMVSTGNWQPDQSLVIEMGGEEFVSLVTPLTEGSEYSIVAVLQRSLLEALRPYQRLRVFISVFFGVALVLSLVAARRISRQVTRPVLRLAEGVHNIQQGHYDQSVPVEQQDEIGELATAFNTMARGLLERDRVRNLLGKVVSPAVAEKLLATNIELGGEECEVTIVFSDIRNFTGLSEHRSPQDLLSILNLYLTRVSGVVEANGGVVDKYIGDAMMALFGAPLRHDDDPSRAIMAARQMGEALEDLNRSFEQQGLPQLEVGIGINTAVVVAGNMGSQARLNYTVIGDGVNLASRLESLTKEYGVPVIVSESTKGKAAGFEFLELDRVRVKGKSEPVTIYCPLPLEGAGADQLAEELQLYYRALESYRARNWSVARSLFVGLQTGYSSRKLYELYITRIDEFLHKQPGEDWDGTFTFDDKG